MKNAIRLKWIRFTEEINALDYLERAGEFIKRTESDPLAWKWVILALHGALCGFAIAACKHSDNLFVVRTSRKGAAHLISLDEAVSMCADPSWMGTLSGGEALKLTPRQEDSLRRLKKTFRNNFEHYVPRVWSIEIHWFPQIAIDVLDVIRFLATPRICTQLRCRPSAGAGAMLLDGHERSPADCVRNVRFPIANRKDVYGGFISRS